MEGAYSQSNGYLNQLAVFAAQLPEKMDWRSSSSGIASVSSQLREMFAMHLGRVIAKVGYFVTVVNVRFRVAMY